MKVLLATPTHSGKVCAQYTMSLVGSVQDLAVQGIAPQISLRAGNSVIGFARNEIIAQFLASDCTDLVMIDDDMEWDPADLVRLLSHDVTLVAAAGRIKTDQPCYCVEPFESGQAEPFSDELIEVKAVGTAFFRVRRDCAEQMAEAYAGSKYQARGVSPELAPHLYCLFSSEIIDGDALSEDYAFCRRWRAIGGKVLVDPFITLGHVGSKTYAGRLYDIMGETQ